MTPSIVVQKFGGTSVANLERLRHVARRIEAEVQAGNQVAVVVSAMAGTTNQLIEWVRNSASIPDDAEHDAVAASGEQITAGLLALMLQDLKIPARSWQGWQLPIKTDGHHRHARITSIDVADMLATLAMGQVAVVAGFQGLSPTNRITTLGRGGSDTTAVALAVALKAQRCDIYTDVDGVYTADPRLVPEARKMASITYAEMLEMASLGAKVLQARSVEQAYRGNVVIRVLSSFEEAPGTMVIREDLAASHDVHAGVHAIVGGSSDEILIGLRAPSHEIFVKFLEGLAREGILVDMLSQGPSKPGMAQQTIDVSFVVAEADWRQTEFLLDVFQREHHLLITAVQHDMRRISLVGLGLRGDPEILSRALRSLAKHAMYVRMIASAEARISFLMERQQLAAAAQALHSAMISFE